jgi:hypothetical protein
MTPVMLLNIAALLTIDGSLMDVQEPPLPSQSFSNVSHCQADKQESVILKCHQSLPSWPSTCPSPWHYMEHNKWAGHQLWWQHDSRLKDSSNFLFSTAGILDVKGFDL